MEILEKAHLLMSVKWGVRDIYLACVVARHTQSGAMNEKTLRLMNGDVSEEQKYLTHLQCVLSLSQCTVHPKPQLGPAHICST